MQHDDTPDLDRSLDLMLDLYQGMAPRSPLVQG